jgi:hypothetical protein
MSTKNTTVIFLTSVLLSLSIVDCYSQIEDRAILVDVKYWKAEGDTGSGKAMYINQYNFQFNLTICDTSGQPLAYFSPKDLEGFSYYTGNEYIEFNSMQNPVDMGRLFLRVVYRGKYTLYQLLDINYKSSILSFLVSYYLWDGKWILPAITSTFESESLLYHFSSCPELEYKIKTGQYRLPQIKEIIEEFENCKLTDQYEFFFE